MISYGPITNTYQLEKRPKICLGGTDASPSAVHSACFFFLGQIAVGCITEDEDYALVHESAKQFGLKESLDIDLYHL